MNLYLRYFDSEILVNTVSEAVDFLTSIGEIEITDKLVSDLRAYAASDMLYPKRYKVHGRNYFIVIKTEAQNMQDFKDKKAVRKPLEDGEWTGPTKYDALYHQQFGWYEGEVMFKRVVVKPETGKCEYRDTTFVARCKAISGKDSYDRIIEYLSRRVDRRSQFPSVKGDNFSFKFLGLCK